MEPKDKAPICNSSVQSHSSVQSSVRAKTDKAWEYATLAVDDKGKKNFICNFCQKVIRGGGINRVKKHLAGIPGEITACKKVSAEVRFTMQSILKETSHKAKETGSVDILDDDDEQEEESQLRNVKARSVKEGKRKATSTVHHFFTKGEWWRLFGVDHPKLQKFAIRILSQTASSSGCERNWSVFERIHTKRRNRLEHQRLNDLVFVHYNLRLQNRLKEDKRTYDPIDYECIDKTDFWVVEEEPEGELNYDDLENMVDEQEHEPGSQTQGNSSGYVLVDDEDDSEFRVLSDRALDAFNTPMSQDP